MEPATEARMSGSERINLMWNFSMLDIAIFIFMLFMPSTYERKRYAGAVPGGRGLHVDNSYIMCDSTVGNGRGQFVTNRVLGMNPLEV